jgi:transcriptional regulator with XRE-family HTH domain
MSVLGDYLRARRELVDPARVGLRVTGVRRTPGLRREEVATLAGISADYYLRLEQGRDRNPSPQVLDALARVLGLNPAATAYLRSLATAPLPTPDAPRELPEGLAHLLATVNLPAYVETRACDVLAANPLAGELGIEAGQNRLRSMFLDPAEQERHEDWGLAACMLVGGFRAGIGTAVDDPEVVRLVGELSLASEVFATMWARQDVKPLLSEPVVVEHPTAGRLELERQKLPARDGLVVVLHVAAPGSATERALDRLREGLRATA